MSTHKMPFELTDHHLTILVDRALKMQYEPRTQLLIVDMWQEDEFGLVRLRDEKALHAYIKKTLVEDHRRTIILPKVDDNGYLWVDKNNLRINKIGWGLLNYK